jgi:N-methylhydantoinase A
MGGWHVAIEKGVNRAVTLDMGGTSCDVSAISGDILVKPDNEVGGLPIRSPSVDVNTIGAGGGSIAWVDDVGIMHVGPQSAGADPGPAAYGKGGMDATVTDANLILGRLNPDFFLGGSLPLNKERARQAIRRVAESIDLSIEETALGIIRISSSNMVQAIREVTVERGVDPRSFVLIPFGGAGPTQAIDIASELSIDSILVPPHPGITSALGLVCADLRVDLMKSVLLPIEEGRIDEILKVFDLLSAEAITRLEQQGALKKDINTEWMIDMRYKGQAHELSISIQDDRHNLAANSREEFEKKHEQSYGYTMHDTPIEWVTVRVIARAKQTRIEPYRHKSEGISRRVETREVILKDGSIVPSKIYRKNQLRAGDIVTGPAIIEQMDTTTYIDPNWICEANSDGTMWLRRVR